MRAAFASELFTLAKKNKKIFVITNDLGYSVLEPFIKAYPNQYLNIGIVEQNMIGVAAGLALSGKIPVVFSIIPFAIMRSFEQIRDDICYHNLNVKVVGVGSGLAYGSLGPTHHSIEDIAITRVLPHMTVLCPGDPIETQLATQQALAMNGPVYLRIHKKGDPIVYKKNPQFTIGKAIQVTKGKDGTIFVTGNMLPTAVAVAKKLREKNISLSVFSMHTIKPLDTEVVITEAKKNVPIFSLEEHSIIGGLGGAVSEVIAESGISVQFTRLGIQDRFTKEVGSQEYLRTVNNLSINSIYTSIKKIIQKKDS